MSAPGRGDAVGRDLQRRRASAPHPNRGRRSRALSARARRAAGAFLLVTFALLAIAPAADAQTVPGLPQNVSATALSATSIFFNWDAPSGGAVRYRADIKKTSSVSWFVGHNPVATTSFLFTGFSFTLEPNTNYDLRVRACSDIQATICSANVAASVTTPAAPPANLRVTSTANENQDPLAWDAPSGDAAITDYKYRRRAIADPALAWEAEVSAGTSASVTVTKPSWQTGYEYQVRAVNSAGDGEWSGALAVGGRPVWEVRGRGHAEGHHHRRHAGRVGLDREPLK